MSNPAQAKMEAKFLENGIVPDVIDNSPKKTAEVYLFTYYNSD